MGASFGMGMQIGSSLIGGLAGGGGGAPTGFDVNPMAGSLAMQQRAIDQEADLLLEQGRITLEEAASSGRQVSRNAHKFKEEQAVKAAESGVLPTEGTPVELMNETVALAGEEIDAIMSRGLAQSDLFRRRANITKNQGRASILGANAQFNTRKAQAEMAAVRAGGSGFGSLIGGLGQIFSQRGFQGGTGGFGFSQTPAAPPPSTGFSIHGGSGGGFHSSIGGF